MKRKLALFSGPLLFILFTLYGQFTDPDDLMTISGIAVWMVIWWLSEAVPMPVTALLPIILFPASGLMPAGEAAAPYADPVIFLFLGGFLIAIAIEKYSLHERVALSLIRITGDTYNGIIAGFMIATALLSMWISNTATTLMMLPMAGSVMGMIRPEVQGRDYLNFKTALLLGIAYAANIGGMATLIGTPPNIVLAGILRKTTGYDMTFSEWLPYGLPFAILMFFICYMLLTRILFRIQGRMEEDLIREIREKSRKPVNWSPAEKRVLAIFLLTSALWIFRGLINSAFQISLLNDTNIALAGAALLFLIPGENGEKALLNWNDAAKLPWGILLLFGGGMSLAKGMEKSGLIRQIGEVAEPLSGNLFLLAAALVLIMLFLTEIMSNVALATVMIPVVIGISFQAQIPPLILSVAVTLASSCAFMMPVATPPNAIVFSSGSITSGQMARAGFILNITAVILLVLAAYFVFPLFGD